MKFSKFTFVSVAASLLISLTGQAKNEMKKVYIYGIATSFNDSTVYLTDIQELDSAWLSNKGFFLVSRENYSYQLRDFVQGQGWEAHPTCSVNFSTNLKKAEKEWAKIHDRYVIGNRKKKKNDAKHENERPPYLVKNISKEQFKFETVAPYTEAEVVNDEPSKKESKKKGKKAKKNKAPKGMSKSAPIPNGKPEENSNK